MLRLNFLHKRSLPASFRSSLSELQPWAVTQAASPPPTVASVKRSPELPRPLLRVCLPNQQSNKFQGIIGSIQIEIF